MGTRYRGEPTEEAEMAKADAEKAAAAAKAAAKADAAKAAAAVEKMQEHIRGVINNANKAADAALNDTREAAAILDDVKPVVGWAVAYWEEADKAAAEAEAFKIADSAGVDSMDKKERKLYRKDNEIYIN